MFGQGVLEPGLLPALTAFFFSHLLPDIPAVLVTFWSAGHDDDSDEEGGTLHPHGFAKWTVLCKRIFGALTWFNGSVQYMEFRGVPLAVCTGSWYFMVCQEAKAYGLQRRQIGFWQQWSSQVTRFLARAVCGCGRIDPLWELSPALHLILYCSLPHLLTSLFRCYLPDYCHWSAPMHGSSPEVPNIMKLNNLSIHFHWNSWWSCCGRHGGRRIVALGELVWAAQCTRLRQTCHKSHRYSHRFLQKTIWQSIAGYWYFQPLQGLIHLYYLYPRRISEDADIEAKRSDGLILNCTSQSTCNSNSPGSCKTSFNLSHCTSQLLPCAFYYMLIIALSLHYHCIIIALSFVYLCVCLTLFCGLCCIILMSHSLFRRAVDGAVEQEGLCLIDFFLPLTLGQHPGHQKSKWSGMSTLSLLQSTPAPWAKKVTGVTGSSIKFSC